MYSKFGLDVRKDSLQTIICIRKSQVRIVLKCPQERHVSFDAQVSTSQSGTHVWRSFSLDSSVLNTFVHDILILIMSFRKGLKEILLVHSRDIADKFQQVSGRIQLGFFGQIVPYRQYLVELTKLYRAGPKGLCKAAHPVYDCSVNLEIQAFQPLYAFHIVGYGLMSDILSPENLVSQGVLDDHQSKTTPPIGSIHLYYHVPGLGYLLYMTHGGKISADGFGRNSISLGQLSAGLLPFHVIRDDLGLFDSSPSSELPPAIIAFIQLKSASQAIPDHICRTAKKAFFLAYQ